MKRVIDKGWRNEVTKRKHRQRSLKSGLDPRENWAYKHSATPCSCYMCRDKKYKRQPKHRPPID